MWPEQSTFFSSDGALWRKGDATPNETQRLAQRILVLGEPRPAIRTFLQARRDGRAQLATAVGLLREVLRREAQGWNEAAERLWVEVHGAWTALPARKQVAVALARLATELGIGANDEVAANVLDASHRELIPLLHATLHANIVDVELSGHQAFHLQALAEAACADGGPRVRELLGVERVVIARALAVAEREGEAFDSLVAALADITDPVQHTAVAAEALAMGRRLLDVETPQPVAGCRTVLSRIERLTAALPLDFSVRRLQARAEVALGVALVRDDNAYNAAAVRLARAVILDALSAEPDDVLSGLRERFAKAKEALRAVLAEGKQLNERGQVLRRELEHDLAEADGFAASPEGQQLRTDVADAVTAQACQRLGLDPATPGSVGILRDLLDELAALEEVTALVDAHARLTRTHPALVSAPWDRIADLCRQLGRVKAPALAELLPRQVADVDIRMHAVLAGAGARLREAFRDQRRRRQPGPLDRWLAWPWLFSSRDWGLKLFAAASVVLILGSFGVRVYNARLTSARDAAFVQLRAADDAGDPDGVLTAARAFLANLQSEDYRLEDVLTAYAHALVRAVGTAARGADDARLAALASEARNLADRLDGPGRADR